MKHRIPQNNGNIDFPLEETALPAGARPGESRDRTEAGHQLLAVSGRVSSPAAGSMVLSHSGCLPSSSSPHPVTGQSSPGPLGDVTPRLAPLPTLAPAVALFGHPSLITVSKKCPAGQTPCSVCFPAGVSDCGGGGWRRKERGPGGLFLPCCAQAEPASALSGPGMDLEIALPLVLRTGFRFPGLRLYPPPRPRASPMLVSKVGSPDMSIAGITEKTRLSSHSLWLVITTRSPPCKAW